VTTQREKDLQAAYKHSRPHTMPGDEIFSDGAEYARKELFERLLESADDPGTKLWLKMHAKEYGL
jgi:hypothetical protein